MRAISSLFTETTLVVPQGPERDGAMALPEGARVVPLRCPPGSDTRRKIAVLLHLPRYLGPMIRHCHSADAVHVPLPGDLPLLGMLTALGMRKRLLARYGGSWWVNSQTTTMNRITRGIMRRFAGGRNVMLVAGEGETPPAPGAHWIFGTALSRAELAGIRPNLDRGLQQRPSMIYAGRLSPEKGLAHLIGAIALLKSGGPERTPTLCLAGDGPQRRELETLVQSSGCQEEVQFAGQLDRASLSRRFMEADFCVQPSLTEALSKAWLDAMAHGLPVLSSEVGAAAEVIGRQEERGWLVPPGESKALAQAIRRITRENIPWPELRRRCRAYVETRTLESWAETIGGHCARQWGMRLQNGKLR